MAILAPRYLPEGEDQREPQALPGVQIVLILAGIIAMSYAGSVEGAAMRTMLVIGGLAALVGLIGFERKARRGCFRDTRR